MAYKQQDYENKKKFSFLQDVSWFATNLQLGWERFRSH